MDSTTKSKVKPGNYIKILEPGAALWNMKKGDIGRIVHINEVQNTMAVMTKGGDLKILLIFDTGIEYIEKTELMEVLYDSNNL